ncbi:PhoD-like phosphatase-domain-containing protein [Geopyxis carbonaria]|nr:PhoD-like phosphatase-domain-containing protein [Geopyxis carbonaria]
MESAPILTTLCSLSTIVLRVSSYLFLRWIPGHVFPPAVFTAFGVFASTFAILFLSKSAYKVLASESTITVTTPLKDTETEYSDGTVAKLPPTVEATETVVYTRKDPHPLRSLLLGLPSPSNWKVSAATFAINTLLTLATWDLTFRSHYFYPSHDLSFARIGYVGPTSAKLLLREPNKEQWPVVVWYSPHDSTTGIMNLVDTIPILHNDTDYTKTVIIPRLEPETKYRWFTSGNHSGTFSTAPLPGQLPKDGKFTFLHSSCIKARFPYSLSSAFEHPLSIEGFKVLARHLDDLKASFMLFLGDWIYIDVPHRHGSDTESYRTAYRQVYGSPDWPGVSSHLPWMHVLDDHEIANDWDAGTTGVYQSAIDPFTHYDHAPNPPSYRPSIASTYYSFSHGAAASFFLLDTRTFRSPNNAPDGTDKSMLGAQQLSDLLAWLRADDGSHWKFIISSVPFTRNWHYASANDTWAAYLHERQRILEAAWAASSGVVVLSGDRHEFAATKFPPPPESRWALENTEERGGNEVWEFSCSPLSQFYLPVRTYQQRDASDVMVKYVPDGNVKWGQVEVETEESEQSVLRYSLWVDGEVHWKWVLTAPAKGRRRVETSKWT